jgi:hypothetical protein
LFLPLLFFATGAFRCLPANIQIAPLWVRRQVADDYNCK